MKSFGKKRRKLYVEQRGRCCYCGEGVPFEDATVEHVVPQALGGSSHKHNLAMACFPCNQRRGAQLSKWMNGLRKNPKAEPPKALGVTPEQQPRAVESAQQALANHSEAQKAHWADHPKLRAALERMRS